MPLAESIESLRILDEVGRLVPRLRRAPDDPPTWHA